MKLLQTSESERRKLTIYTFVALCVCSSVRRVSTEYTYLIRKSNKRETVFIMIQNNQMRVLNNTKCKDSDTLCTEWSFRTSNNRLKKNFSKHRCCCCFLLLLCRFLRRASNALFTVSLQCIVLLHSWNIVSHFPTSILKTNNTGGKTKKKLSTDEKKTLDSTYFSIVMCRTSRVF